MWRLAVLVLVVVTVAVLMIAGFEPSVALGIIAACGMVAADTTARLFGDPKPGV